MPQMGITRCTNVTGLDRIGIPVIVVCRPNSRPIAVSQGKGLTVDGAKVSGLMESAKTYHAERIDHLLRLSSLLIWKNISG
jgi:YcaO-like protein with predicted kinase domain